MDSIYITHQADKVVGMITQTYNINLIPGGQIVNVHVSQYDVGRIITFNLLNGDAVFTPPSGTTATIEGTKPDEKGFALNATLSGTTASFVTTANMCAVAGKTICEFRLKQGNRDIGTANFILDVERAGLADDIDVSGTEIPAYIDAARENAEKAEKSAEAAAKSAEDAAESAKEAAESAEKAAGGSAEDSEAWAVGQRKGIDVDPSDETYHNNSKYYAGIAKDAAEEALINIGEAGYLGFMIDERGHLIMTKSSVLTYLDFDLDEKHKDLIVTVTDTSGVQV